MNVNSVMSQFWTQFQQAIQTGTASAAAGEGSPAGSSTGAPSLGAKSSDAAGVNPGASADVSSIGQMLAQLQQLSQSNPSGFKSVMTGMSQALATQAQQGGAGSQVLQSLSNDFASAAQSNSLSALTGNQQGQPTTSGRHHHHHGGGGGAGGSESPMQSVMDEMLAAFQSAVGGTTATASTAPPAVATAPTSSGTSVTA